MVVEFEKEYLKELFETGKTSDKKHRFQPQIIDGYLKCVWHLKRASRIEDLFGINSLNYKVLKGDKAGTSAVRINNQYRLEFKVEEGYLEQKVTICRLEDITNHYK